MRNRQGMGTAMCSNLHSVQYRWAEPPSAERDAPAVVIHASRKSADQSHDLIPLKDKNLPSGLF